MNIVFFKKPPEEIFCVKPGNLHIIYIQYNKLKLENSCIWFSRSIQIALPLPSLLSLSHNFICTQYESYLSGFFPERGERHKKYLVWAPQGLQLITWHPVDLTNKQLLHLTLVRDKILVRILTPRQNPIEAPCKINNSSITRSKICARGRYEIYTSLSCNCGEKYVQKVSIP